MRQLVLTQLLELADDAHRCSDRHRDALFRGTVSLHLVDLTGFNANVTLELGLAHALARKALILGQVGTEKRLFPSIAKLRVAPYSLDDRSAA